MFSRRTDWKLAPNRFTEAVDRFRAGRPGLRLTSPLPTLRGSIWAYDEAAILKSLSSPDSLRYQPEAKGLLSARQAVAGLLRIPDLYRFFGTEILLTTSTSEAYSFIFRLVCDPGDEVLVPVPSYPLFQFLAELEDVKLVPIRTHL